MQKTVATSCAKKPKRRYLLLCLRRRVPVDTDDPEASATHAMADAMDEEPFPTERELQLLAQLKEKEQQVNVLVVSDSQS